MFLKFTIENIKNNTNIGIHFACVFVHRVRFCIIGVKSLRLRFFFLLKRKKEKRRKQNFL